MSTFWCHLVRDEVWGSVAGKKGLTSKLRHRWVDWKPSMDWLGRAKEKVTSLFCNDKHIFCGQGSSLVRVYKVTSGEWVRDLVPRDATSSEPVDQSHYLGRSKTLLAGGKKLVVSVAWDVFITVWSTEGNMDWLTSYECMSEDCRETPFRCDECGNLLKEPVCCCDEEGTLSAGGCNAQIYEIKVTPDDGKIVFLATFHDSYSSMWIMKKSEENGWTAVEVPIDENCGPGTCYLGYAELGCHGNPFILCHSGRLKDFRLCFDSAEETFEDKCQHPHNDEGLEFDESETSGICGLFMEPPYLVLVNRNPDYAEDSVALRVYQMDTYKALKAFGYSRGTCSQLTTNECAVVQLQSTRSTDQCGDYVLIYDKKMLLDPTKTAEDVKTQRIEINQETLMMSINTTSLVFVGNQPWRSNVDLGVLNFWLERGTMGFQDEDKQTT